MPEDQQPPPRRGWSKAARRRAAAKRGKLMHDWAGGDGHSDPPQDPAATVCGTCGHKGGCDCR